LDDLNNSKSGAILTKSSTIEPRKGNKFPRFYLKDKYFSINSMGLPNSGYKYYVDYYLQNKCKKPYIQSLYPFNSNELVEMFQYINSKIKRTTSYSLEINVSCPNVDNETSMSMIDEYLDIIKQNNIHNIPVGLKLAPYITSSDFDRVGNILLKYTDSLGYITCSNSVMGLEIDTDTDTTVITPNSGLGGIGGNTCRSIGLSNVYNFHMRLGNKIDIVGCGGVSSGNDVYAYILAGANAVQLGTSFYSEGVGIFDRVSKELLDIMNSKGYSDIDEFKGKLINKIKSSL